MPKSKAIIKKYEMFPKDAHEAFINGKCFAKEGTVKEKMYPTLSMVITEKTPQSFLAIEFKKSIVCAIALQCKNDMSIALISASMGEFSKISIENSGAKLKFS